MSKTGSFAGLGGNVPAAALATGLVPVPATTYSTLQAAVNNTVSGDIYLPPGTYTGNVAVPPNVRMIGADKNSVFINGKVSLAAGESNTLANLTINPQNAADDALSCNGIHRCRFQDLILNGQTAASGIHIFGPAANPSIYNAFEDIDVIFSNGTTGAGLFIQATAAGDYVNGNRFTNITARGTVGNKMGNGFYIGLGGDAGTISHNLFERAYIQYVTNTGLATNAVATLNTFIDPEVESANLAYGFNGANNTYINPKGFGNTTLFGGYGAMAAGTVILTSQPTAATKQTMLNALYPTTVPAIAGGAALGTAPPAPTIAGTDQRGTLAFGTGTAPPAGGVVATVTFGAALANVPGGIVFQALNAVSAPLANTLWVSGVTANGFTINTTATLGVSQPAGTYSFMFSVTP